MTEDIRWFVGLDWAREKHRVVVLDAKGESVAERDVTHDGAALSELCAWLIEVTGAQPAQIAVAIETPRGPIVETLLERGFAVYSINPKQLDRFRDRFTGGGAFGHSTWDSAGGFNLTGGFLGGTIGYNCSAPCAAESDTRSTGSCPM